MDLASNKDFQKAPSSMCKKRESYIYYFFVFTSMFNYCMNSILRNTDYNFITEGLFANYLGLKSSS